jgi:hypothetical protein
MTPLTIMAKRRHHCCSNWFKRESRARYCNGVIPAMGISGLFDALKGYVRPCHIETLRGQRVGIDTYSWLHKASFGCASGVTAA